MEFSELRQDWSNPFFVNNHINYVDFIPIIIFYPWINYCIQKRIGKFLMHKNWMIIHLIQYLLMYNISNQHHSIKRTLIDINQLSNDWGKNWVTLPKHKVRIKRRGSQMLTFFTERAIWIFSCPLTSNNRSAHI